MKILVTGADGFVGRHLCMFLRARGDAVVELVGPGKTGGRAVDVTDARAVHDAVADAKPEGTIHLAGLSSVALSHQQPALAYAVNVQGTVNLLSALRDEAPKSRVLLIGSGEIYGPIAPGLQAFEEYPVHPTSPYAASKLGAEQAGLQFFRSYGLEVVCARPFNHLGAGQDPAFVVPSFAAQLLAIRRGEHAPVLKVGNLEPIRDFSHVADVIEAYRLLLDRGLPGGVYNVCSGEGRTIRSLVDELVELVGVKVEIEIDPTRVRKVDVPYLVGHPMRIERLGWKRTRTVRQALKEVLGL